MVDKVEQFLKDFLSSLQVAKIYTVKHPKFEESAEVVFNQLQDVLSSREEMVIGIVGEELAFEKEIFFDLSRKAKGVILYLKDAGVERVSFHRGIKKKELVDFISYLVTYSSQLNIDIQQYFSGIGIRNITVGRIKVSSDELLEEEVRDSINYLKQYESSLERITHAMDSILDNQDVDYLELRFTMVNVMENLVGKYNVLLKLSTVKKYDVVTFGHILNVSILSMYLSSKLGFSKDDVLDIGVAALFHDIGKLYISRSIVKKPDRLTDEEFAKITSHTILGAEILLKYVDTLGYLPLVVAFEHHMKCDLAGYPKVDFPLVPHIASKIVSICDVYDALSNRRSYKRDYPPNMVYDIMMKEKGRGFDTALLTKFFRVMGVWPIGTIVKLDNSKIAIVREENEDDIFSPKVEIISSEETKIFIDLKENQQIKIVGALNPLAEGKQYMHLI